MFDTLRKFIYRLLRKSEDYTKTDMVYLAKGGAWLSAGKVVYTLFAFLLSIAFANLLPQTTYGTYQYVLSIFAILSIPALGSMGTAIEQAVARGKEATFIPALRKKLLWSLAGAGASFAVAGYYFWKGSETLGWAFALAAVFVPLVNTFTMYLSYLRGKKDFKTATQYGLTTNVVSIVLLIIALFFTDNLYILLSVYFVPNALLPWYFMRKTLRKHPPNEEHDEEAIQYGTYLSALGIIQKVAKGADKLILWHVLGPASVAVYAFAVTPVNQLRNVVMLVNTLAFPKLSKQTDDSLKESLPGKVMRFFVIIIPLVGLYYLVAPYFFRIFYPQYMEALGPSLLFSSVLLLAPFKLYSSSLLARVKKKHIAVLRIVAPSIRIAAFGILTPLYGVHGAVVAFLVSEVANSLISYILFKRM